MREYNAESPKQGRKRFNSIAKTQYIADLVIIYLWVKRSNRYIPEHRRVKQPPQKPVIGLLCRQMWLNSGVVLGSNPASLCV